MFTRPSDFFDTEGPMTEHTIRRGLRKLEFFPARGEDEATAEARVEFASDAPLPAGELVEISLGLRDGKLRSLVGVPRLIERQGQAASQGEYLYRLSGQITEHPG